MLCTSLFENVCVCVFNVYICVWFSVCLSLKVYEPLGVQAGLNLSYAFLFP